MDVFERFGLCAGPFDATPDPTFYVDVAAHAETRATVEFAIHAGKGVVIVVGDSGTGKTLQARLACSVASPTHCVVWVRPTSTASDQLDTTVFRPGALRDGGTGPGELLTLDEWRRAPA